MIRQTVSTLTQSRFYSPAFNAAIFDGPFRIYFTQIQESAALKLYFRLQEQLKIEDTPIKEQLKVQGTAIFLMVYPSDETFQNAFAGADPIVKDRLGGDLVLGVKGPIHDHQLDLIVQEVLSLASEAQKKASEKLKLFDLGEQPETAELI